MAKERKCQVIGCAVATGKKGSFTEQAQKVPFLGAIAGYTGRVAFPYDAVEEQFRKRINDLIGDDQMKHIKLKDKRKELGSVRAGWAATKNVTKALVKGVPLTPKQLSKAMEHGVSSLDPNKWKGVWKQGPLEFEIEAKGNAYFDKEVVEAFNYMCDNDITVQIGRRRIGAFESPPEKKTYRSAPLEKVIESYNSDTNSVNWETCPYKETKVKMTTRRKGIVKAIPILLKTQKENQPQTFEEDEKRKIVLRANKMISEFETELYSRAQEDRAECCTAIKQADDMFDTGNMEAYNQSIDEVVRTSCPNMEIPIKSKRPSNVIEQANNIAWDRILEEKC